MDELRDEILDDENAEALLDDSIFEEIDLDELDDDDIKTTLKDDDEDEDEEEEIFDELDALIAEEDEDDGFDFDGDDDY